MMSLDQLLSDHLDAAAELTPVGAGPAPEMIRATGRRRTDRRNAIVGTVMAVVLALGGVGLWSAIANVDQNVSVADVDGVFATQSPVVATDDGFVAFRNVFDDLDGDPHLEIHRSENGTTWNRIDPINLPDIFVGDHAFFDEGRFVLVGTRIGEVNPQNFVVATSVDLVEWTSSELKLEHNRDFSPLAAYSSEHGLVMAFEDHGGGTFHSFDLVNFVRNSDLLVVDHLTSGIDGLFASAKFRDDGIDSDNVLVWFDRDATASGSWVVVLGDAGTDPRVRRNGAIDGLAVIGTFHSTTPGEPNLVNPSDLEFSPRPGVPFASTGLSSKGGGDVWVKDLEVSDLGNAVAYSEFIGDEGLATSHVAYSADGLAWLVVGTDFDGWVARIALGENEIVATVVSHDSLRTELVRIPINEN